MKGLFLEALCIWKWIVVPLRKMQNTVLEISRERAADKNNTWPLWRITAWHKYKAR